MGWSKTERLSMVREFVNDKSSDQTTFAEVLSLAEISTGATRRFLDEFGIVFQELKTIAEYIESLKREIGFLKANDIKEQRIPTAGQELGAVCDATEAATNTIMECAEAVMDADVSDAAAYKSFVDEKMMIVFEACAFQDITGQRITKVMETLQLIDERVSRFATAVHSNDAASGTSAAEHAREERKQQLLLNGPQLEGPETSQSEVDAMFA